MLGLLFRGLLSEKQSAWIARCAEGGLLLFHAGPTRKHVSVAHKLLRLVRPGRVRVGRERTLCELRDGLSRAEGFTLLFQRRASISDSAHDDAARDTANVDRASADAAADRDFRFDRSHEGG